MVESEVEKYTIWDLYSWSLRHLETLTKSLSELAKEVTIEKRGSTSAGFFKRMRSTAESAATIQRAWKKVKNERKARSPRLVTESLRKVATPAPRSDSPLIFLLPSQSPNISPDKPPTTPLGSATARPADPEADSAVATAAAARAAAEILRTGAVPPRIPLEHRSKAKTQRFGSNFFCAGPRLKVRKDIKSAAATNDNGDGDAAAGGGRPDDAAAAGEEDGGACAVS